MAREYTLGVFQPELEALDRERAGALAARAACGARWRASGGNAAWSRRLGGVRPDDVAGVEDWARLPFLTKDELRDAYPFGLACGRRRGLPPRPHVERHHRQSDPESLHGRRRRAVGRGDGALLRGGRASPATTSSRSRRRSGSSPAASASTTAPSARARMVIPDRRRPHAAAAPLMRDLGTPWCRHRHVPAAAHRGRPRGGFDLGSLRLRVGILGSEMWSDELRARIERELGDPDLRHHRHDGDGRPRARHRLRRARRHSRVGGPLLRRDRRPGDRRRSRPTAHEGELVVSTLTREGLPLVRYRTHDLTRIVSRAPLRVRADVAASGPPARPHRRHGDLQGRELLSAPGRASCRCASPASATSTRSSSTRTGGDR